MKKRSMYGALTDKNNPVSMKEILRELKKDRKESDRNFDDIRGSSNPNEKFSRRKFNRKSLFAYVNWLISR